MTVQQLEHVPSLPRLYGKAAITARGRHGDRLPDVSYELRNLSIDRDRLASYALVCGFRQSDILPPTYPHILGFPAAVSLMVDPAFPFPLPGLVHVNNRITQKRNVRADERLTVCVRCADLRPHRRGRQFDMITEVMSNGDAVWSEVSTYLRRERRSSHPLPGPPPKGERDAGETVRPTAIWRVSRDIGRRYAAVSGDVNPIHMNPLVARLFGFKRAIAHGMWLKARCLAALEGRLPGGLTVEVEFKSPLLLPSTVAFSANRAGDAWSIAVANAKSGRLHLVGRALGASDAASAPRLAAR